MSKEKYVGVKYNPICLGNFKPNATELKLIKQLISAGKVYPRLGMFDQNGGNISVRVKDGILIKCTGCFPNKLKIADFAKVTKVTPYKVFYYGSQQPSSEARWHFGIYLIRKDVNAALHAHDREALNCKIKLPEIGYAPETSYGTLKSAHAVKAAAKKHDYLIQKNHGVIALGKNVKIALNLLIKYHDRFKKINR